MHIEFVYFILFYFEERYIDTSLKMKSIFVCLPQTRLYGHITLFEHIFTVF